MGNLAGDANALVINFTGGAGVDTNYGTADRGFTGTGLADERERFTLVNVERSVFDCTHGIVAFAEGDVNIFQRKENFLAACINRSFFGQMGNPTLFCGNFFFMFHSSTLPLNIERFNHLVVDVVDRGRLVDLGRSGIKQPSLCIVSFRDLEHRRSFDDIDFQTIRISRCEGIARNLIVERRRRTGD